MAAHHEDTYTINATLYQLIAAIRDPAFANHLNVSIQSEGPTPTGVMYHIRHGVTFTSWGENVTLTLTATGPATTHLAIRSECSMPTQIIDWGKNKQVVCNIYEYLAANAARYPGGQSQPAQPAPQPQYQPPQPAQAPAFCRHCGRPLSPGSVFCSGCGSKI